MSKTQKDSLPKINKQITSREVRLIDDKGEMLGVFPLFDAIRKADFVGLDLVEIVPGSTPPVCKIMDFGKFKYESKKKLQESKKKQKIVTLKEIKFRPNIGQNDFDVKVRSINKFLNEGDKVKVSVWFRGREIVHNDIGKTLLNKVIEVVSDNAKIESEPKMEGRQIVMIMSPVPKVPE